MQKILLLNLPFDRPVQRDYGCPHGVKADYYWPPIDLLLFGSIVHEAGELSYLDCLAGKMVWSDCLEKIRGINPDVVFTILSSITIESDLKLLDELKETLPSISVWASGDLVFFTSKQYAVIDVYVRDLTNTMKILELVRSNVKSGAVESESGGEFSVGVFPHELLRGYGYMMPYSLHRGITSVLTNFGCPFQCTFCNSNGLPFKKRKIEEVIQELRYVQSIGVKEVVFRDFTFNLSNIDHLCDEIMKNDIRLAWSCWSRVDLVHAEILHKMRRAGCYLISYGVESGEDAILAKTNKRLTTNNIKEMVALTKAAGIEVLVSVIFGFSDEDTKQTVSYIHNLDPDYLAINLLAPRVGSDISNNRLRWASESSVDSLFSANRDLVRLRDLSEKTFYLRPRKLLRYIVLSLKSRQRFFIFLQNAVGLLRKWQYPNR